MGPLCFGRGSHRKRIGRDLEISAESEQQIRDAVRKEKVDEVQEPFALGDVSYHLRERIGEGGQGWVFKANWDEPGGLVVIVKVLRPDAEGDRRARERLEIHDESLPAGARKDCRDKRSRSKDDRRNGAIWARAPPNER